MVSVRPHLAETGLTFPNQGRLASRKRPNCSGNIRAIGANCCRESRVPLVVRFAVVLWLSSICARAAAPEPLVERWFAAQTNLHSWTADFVQTRSLKALSQPLVGSGKVWVTNGGQFRWEMGQPAQTIALRQPDQLLIIYPRLKRAEKYPLVGVPPGPLKDALALLDASVPRDRATMEQRFRLLSASLTNSVLEMALQPKSASARKFIAGVLIAFRINDFTIASTEMRFADGSILRNDFDQVLTNAPIDPSLFEPKLPADYAVVEPLRH